MKIDLNFKIKGLDATDIPDSNAGKILANVLVSGTKGDALKFYGWAVKLYADEAIDVDKSDLQKIKTFVSDSDNLPIITKAQILDVLNNVKE